jgi:hypothetical protein
VAFHNTRNRSVLCLQQGVQSSNEGPHQDRGRSGESSAAVRPARMWRRRYGVGRDSGEELPAAPGQPGEGQTICGCPLPKDGFRSRAVALQDHNMLKSGPVSNAKKRHGPPGLFLSTAVRAVIREPGRNKPQSIESPLPVIALSMSVSSFGLSSRLCRLQ